MMAGSRQRGFGLLELLAVLALGTLLAAGVLALLDGHWQRARLQGSARHHALLAAATQRYLDARRDALPAQVPANQATLLALTTLSSAGYLPAGFSSTNGHGQQACVVLRRTGTGLDERLDALVSASGGLTPGPADLAEMAALAGAGAGFTGDEVPLRARGAFGAWTLDAAALQPFLGAACPGGAIGPGRLVSTLRLSLGPDEGAPDYLARRGSAADAPWNVMDTPLAIGAGATASAGEACGADPAIALDAGRALLTCAGDGQWKRQAAARSWKETRPRYSDLPQDDARGDVRLTADTRRAYTARGAGNWQALAVDQNGHLEAPGVARAGTLAARGDMRVGTPGSGVGTMTVLSDLKVANDIRAERNVNGHAVNVSGWSIAHAHFIDLSAHPAWAGKPCHLQGQKVDPYSTERGILYPVGSMKHDVNGNTMSCQAPWNQFRYMNGQMTP